MTGLQRVAYSSESRLCCLLALHPSFFLRSSVLSAGWTSCSLITSSPPFSCLSSLLLRVPVFSPHKPSSLFLCCSTRLQMTSEQSYLEFRRSSDADLLPFLYSPGLSRHVKVSPGFSSWHEISQRSSEPKESQLWFGPSRPQTLFDQECYCLRVWHWTPCF